MTQCPVARRPRRSPALQRTQGPWQIAATGAPRGGQRGAQLEHGLRAAQVIGGVAAGDDDGVDAVRVQLLDDRVGGDRHPVHARVDARVEPGHRHATPSCERERPEDATVGGLVVSGDDHLGPLLLEPQLRVVELDVLVERRREDGDARPG